MELRSAAITNIKERNTESKQINTIKTLEEQRPGFRNKLADQLAKLTSSRQENLLPPPPPVVNTTTTTNNNTEVTDNTSTLSGIVPTSSTTNQIPSSIQDAIDKAPKRKMYKIP